MSKIKKNKILFFPGLLITNFGSILFAFASGLYLLQKTGKSEIFAGNILFSSLPLVFASIFFGKIIDKFSKKKILVVSDILNGVLMITIYFLWSEVEQIYLVFIGSLLTTILGLLVTLTFEAGKPQLFKKDELIDINSYSSIIQSLTGVLGPVLGGVIFSFYDIKIFILLNGLSFFISALTESFLTFESIEKKKSEKNGFLIGFKFIKSSKKMKEFVLLIVIANIGFAFVCTVPVPYLLINYYKFQDTVYGGIMGMISVGMILGGLIVSKFKLKLEIKSFVPIYFILGVLSLIMSTLYFVELNSVYLIIIIGTLVFGVGLSIPFIDIPLITFLQSNSPEGIRGQVIGSFISIVKIVLPISLLISGKVVDSTSPFISIFIGGITFFIGVVLSKRMWASWTQRKYSSKSSKS